MFVPLQKQWAHTFVVLISPESTAQSELLRSVYVRRGNTFVLKTSLPNSLIKIQNNFKKFLVMPSAKLLKLFHSTEQNGRHMIAKTRNIRKRHLYLGH